MPSFLFQNTIQLTLLGMHQCSHMYHSLSKTIVITIAVKVLGMLHYTLIPFHCIQVDIETLIQSSCQIVQFLRSKNSIHDLAYFDPHIVFIEVCDTPHKTEFRRKKPPKFVPLKLEIYLN